jgi:hypothetical protein
VSTRSRSNPWWKTERRTATLPTLTLMTLREALEFLNEERKHGRPDPSIQWWPEPERVTYIMPRPNGVLRTLKGDS